MGGGERELEKGKRSSLLATHPFFCALSSASSSHWVTSASVNNPKPLRRNMRAEVFLACLSLTLLMNSFQESSMSDCQSLSLGFTCGGFEYAFTASQAVALASPRTAL